MLPPFVRRFFDRPTAAMADAAGIATADALCLVYPAPTTAQMFGEVETRRCSLLAADAEVLHVLNRDNEIAEPSR